MTTSRTLSAGVSSGSPSPLRWACLGAEEAWPRRSRECRCFIPGRILPLGAGEAHPRGAPTGGFRTVVNTRSTG
eukprot:6171033-Pyramimonas_sp.AAC.1